LEGQIWEVNGFNFDDAVIIKPISPGKLLIEKLDLNPKENADSPKIN